MRGNLVRTAVDWILTVPFLLLFGITLALFDPLQRLARAFGPRPHEIVVGVMQVVLLGIFRIVGTRLEIERSQGIRSWTPYLLVSNHQSMFDVPLCGALLFSNFPKYVSKKELARWIPSISYNLRRGGNAVIDRGDSEQALSAIRALGEAVVERKVSAVIYPEGTRARGGQLRPFRARGALALMEAAPAVPVVPVTIDGSWRLLANNLLPVPCGTLVRIRFGDPIDRSRKEDDRRVLEAAREEIRSTLSRWRNEPIDLPQRAS